MHNMQVVSDVSTVQYLIEIKRFGEWDRHITVSCNLLDHIDSIMKTFPNSEVRYTPITTRTLVTQTTGSHINLGSYNVNEVL